MDTIEHRQKLSLKNKISEAPVPRDYESRNRERCKVQAAMSTGSTALEAGEQGRFTRALLKTHGLPGGYTEYVTRTRRYQD